MRAEAFAMRLVYYARTREHDRANIVKIGCRVLSVRYKRVKIEWSSEIFDTVYCLSSLYNLLHYSCNLLLPTHSFPYKHLLNLRHQISLANPIEQVKRLKKKTITKEVVS